MGKGMEGVGGEGEPAPSDPPATPFPQPPNRHFLSLVGISARWSDHGSPSSLPSRCQAAAGPTARRRTEELNLTGRLQGRRAFKSSASNLRADTGLRPVVEMFLVHPNVVLMSNNSSGA